MKIAVVLFMVLITTFGYSQITFQENIIYSNNIDISTVYHVDIDGDGDVDILASLYGNNEIVWFENIDGIGSFSTKKIITTNVNANSAWSVCAVDIDGDGDIDVLSHNDNRMIWYPNIDGEGNFGTVQVIDTCLSAVRGVNVFDIDNDGLSDVFAIFSSMPSIMVLYKNLGGTFSSGDTIIDDLECPFVFADMDADNDVDIVHTTMNTCIPNWIENSDGLGTFTQGHPVNYLVSGTSSIALIDVDNDGDKDIVSDGMYKSVGSILWYNNNDGLGNFDIDTAIVIDTNISALGCHSIEVADIDNDGNDDVIIATMEDTIFCVTWYKKDEFGNFDSPQIVSADIGWGHSISVVDIDNDGDIDILAKLNNTKIVWYKNMLINNIEEINQVSFSIYPNPTKNTIIIQSKFKVAKIELYNNLGQLVLTKQNTQNVDVSNLVKGVYTCKIFNKNGSLGTEKVIIE